MAFPDFQPTYPDQTVSKALRTFAVVAAAAGLFATIGPVSGSRDVAFAQSNHPVPFARTMLYQSLAYVEAAPFPEAPQVDKWFSPLSEPYKFKRALPTPEHPALFFVKAAPFPETTDPGKWLEPLSEPYKFKRALPTHEQQALAFVKAAPFPESTDPGKWFEPLSEPYKFKRALPAHQQQSIAFVEASPFAETVSVDRWLLPLNEPTRRIQRLEGGQAPFVRPQSAAEIITPDKWFALLSEPTRTRRIPPSDAAFVATVAAGSGNILFNSSVSSVLFARSTVYQTHFAPITLSTVETVTVDKWMAALSGPVPDSYESIDLSFTFSAVEPSFGWYEPLGEPVRSRAQSAAVRHSATAFVATVAPPIPGSGDVLFSASISSVLFQYSFQYLAKVEPVSFAGSVVPPVVIVPPPTDGGGVGRIARGGPSTFRWPAIKKKRKTRDDELAELQAFLQELADSKPNIELERPPTVYRGPLAATFFEQPRFEPKAAPKPATIAAKPIAPQVEAVKPNDDEEAVLLLINHEQEMLLDLLRSLL